MVVKREGSHYTLRSKAGKLLSKHKNRKEAYAQEKAIQESKKRRQK